MDWGWTIGVGVGLDVAIGVGVWVLHKLRKAKATKPAPAPPVKRYTYLGSGTSEPGDADKYDYKKAVAAKQKADERDSKHRALHAKVLVKKRQKPTADVVQIDDRRIAK